MFVLVSILLFVVISVVTASHNKHTGCRYHYCSNLFDPATPLTVYFLSVLLVYIFILCFMFRPSSMKSSTVLCYYINELTYLLTMLTSLNQNTELHMH